MFVYGKTSLEKVDSKRREEREPIFLAGEGSPLTNECNSNIPSHLNVTFVLHFLEAYMLVFHIRRDPLRRPAKNT